MLLERLLDNLSLTVEAFATCRVAHGWRLSLPAFESVTLHYVLQGEGAVRDADGNSALLPGGSLAVVPPHLIHSLECGVGPFGEVPAASRPPPASELADLTAGPPDEASLLVACGRLEVTYGGTIGLFDRLHRIIVLDFSGDSGMSTTFTGMLEELRRGQPGTRAMTSTLMQGCLIRVLRECCVHEDCSVSWLTALEDPALASVLDTMVEHPEQPHTVASLAARAFMSRSAFARRFRESFGQPPLVYLRGIRLRHAAQLLRKSPPLPIASVARRSGFASRSQFSRAFRDYFGSSPTDFRA